MRRHVSKTNFHEEFLNWVCIMCGRKSDRQLSKAQREILNQYDEFYRNSTLLPRGICGFCRLKLTSGGFEPFKGHIDFILQLMKKRRDTRSRTSTMFVALPKTVLEYDESLPLCFQNGNDVGWRREMKWVKAEMTTMRRKKKEN